MNSDTSPIEDKENRAVFSSPHGLSKEDELNTTVESVFNKSTDPAPFDDFPFEYV